MIPCAGGFVDAKPLEDCQSFTYMLDYVQKDYGQTHYKLETQGVSLEHLEGREGYCDVRLSYGDGRQQLNKPPQIFTSHVCILSSQPEAAAGAFRPSAQVCAAVRHSCNCFVLSPQGRGTDWPRAQAMWDMMMGFRMELKSALLSKSAVFFSDDPT